jgi:hypothetical protein
LFAGLTAKLGEASVRQALTGQIQSALAHVMSQKPTEGAARGSAQAAPNAADIVAEIIRTAQQPPAIERGPISAQGFVWGFSVYVPESEMAALLAGGTALATLTAAVGGALSGTWAAPFIAVLAAYIAAELAWMKAIDKGRGVAVSMSWVAPAIFVPTAL